MLRPNFPGTGVIVFCCHLILYFQNNICDTFSSLDAAVQSQQDFFDSVKPPENVPGQVLAIAEVLEQKVYEFESTALRTFEQFFQTLPMASRQELMERLRAYRDFVFAAAGVHRTDADDRGFSADQVVPYWW